MNFIKRLFRLVSHLAKLYIAWVVLRLGFFPKFANDKPWVFGGCSNRYFADNSAALFEHVCRELPNVDAYWVIDENSPDVCLAEKVGNVLYAGKFKTYLVILSAQVHVISHGARDVPGCDSRINTAFRVRLGHGLTALKKTQGSKLRPLMDRNRQFDLVPVASEYEKENKLEWGFDESKLVITGLPRFDKLISAKQEFEKKHVESERPSTIFFLPTWRSWLDGASTAERTKHFYDHVFGVFKNQRLLDFLEAKNICVRLCPHMGMRKDFVSRLDVLNLDRVSLVDSYAALSSEIASCNLLITDYSSVAWDSLYVGTPVVFYQFDRDSFVKARGTHMNLNKKEGELFGPTCESSEKLVTLLTEQWQTRHFRDNWRPKMDETSKTVFAFSDGQNCERVLTEINNRLEVRE